MAILLFVFCKPASAQDSVVYKPMPWQVSLVPGISTHGRADRQTVNVVSLSLVGGVESGLRGAELGGVFNLDLHNVGYAQVAGIFNYVGGKLRGVQAAGLANVGLAAVRGVQAAGLSNLNYGVVAGVQVAGLANLTHGSVLGAQVAGLTNISRDTVRGVQIAGLANLSHTAVRGAQVAGLYNYAHRLKGVQIGIVNVADSSSGYSIGLVNIVRRNGLRQISVWEEDVTGVSVGFKSGTSRLYGILMVGGDDWDLIRTYSAGSGLGTNMPLGGALSFTAEAVEQEVFDDRWKYLGEIVRFKPSLTLRISPHASIFAGPTFNLYSAASRLPLGAHASDIPGNPWPANTWGKKTAVWAGGTVGLNLF